LLPTWHRSQTTTWDANPRNRCATRDVLVVATRSTDGVIGYSAVHPEDCEMFLLFVDPAHAGGGVGRTVRESDFRGTRLREPRLVKPL
jgi:hypothetical protein